MATQNNGERTFTAGEALNAFCRVKLSAAETVVYADAGDDYIGVTQDSVADEGQVLVRLKSMAGTMKVTAAGAFSAGDYLYGAADGEVDDVETGSAQFVALEAASADGDIVEALPTEVSLGAEERVTGGAGGVSAADLVYVSAQSGGEQTVLKAQGTSAGLFANYICPNAIAESAQGIALTQYLLTGVNTNTGSVGDPVYLSDGTAGGWTLTKPTGVAFAAGAEVYVTSGGMLTGTDTANTFVGLTMAAATSGAGLTDVRVGLKGMAPNALTI